MRRLLLGVPLSSTDVSASCFDIDLSRICSEDVAGGSVCLDCTSSSISLFMIDILQQEDNERNTDDGCGLDVLHCHVESKYVNSKLS
jgi:hypothetical protein